MKLYKFLLILILQISVLQLPLHFYLELFKAFKTQLQLLVVVS